MIIGQDRPDLPQSAGEMLHGRKRMRTRDAQVLLLLDPFVGFGHIGRRAAIDVARHASVAPMLHVGGTETDTRHGCMPIARSCSSATASTSAHVKGPDPFLPSSSGPAAAKSSAKRLRLDHILHG
jgi:hypothetical protein